MKTTSRCVLLALGLAAQLVSATPLQARHDALPQAWVQHRHHHHSAPAASSAAASSDSSAAASSDSSAAASSVASSSSAIAAVSTTLATVISSTVATAVVSSTADVSSSSSMVSIASTTSTAVVAKSTSSLSPGGIKAGLSGYVGIQDTDAFSSLSDYISWYSDYTPTTPDSAGVQGVGMLWGDGTSCPSSTDEATRLADFNTLVASSTPSIMFGFYEPDCDCPDSSDISDPAVGTAKWNSLLAPLGPKGTVLGSPSMCKQTAEDWLTPFSIDSTTGATLLDAEWDVTSIHINVNTLAKAQADVEYYAAKYGRPVWVSEFACVDSGDNIWAPCTDQSEIDDFINAVVPFFEGNASVVAYGPSNGDGLGDTWPLTDSSTGELTATGTTYLNALKAL